MCQILIKVSLAHSFRKDWQEMDRMRARRLGIAKILATIEMSARVM
jgi:hypothetical protein